jgi:uncharacterized protein YbjT (DUF2867 family)
MAEFFSMARKGRVYLIGSGEWKTNPIHGEDLAEVCVDAIEKNKQEIRAGGPETFTHNEIAATAFEVLGKEPQITHIPGWVKTVLLWIVRMFTGSRVYGPLEFFLTVMSMDMIAPEYGRHTLRQYFSQLNAMDE